MTPSVSGDKRKVESISVSLPGHELSWAGEGPRSNVLSLGTEDGSFFNFNIEDNDQNSTLKPTLIVNPGECINSIAFDRNRLAVSTRAEIAIHDLHQINESVHKFTIIDRGSHEIVKMPLGNFIAPIGADGLLYLEPREDEVVSWTVRSKEDRFYNYKASVLKDTRRGECIACALRRDGLSIVARNGDSWSGSRWTFSSNDIVDVCSIASQEFPFGIAAVGIDNSLHFVRDVFTDRQPQTFRFDELTGKAYRLLGSHGHIFLLTSRCLYLFFDLARHFLNGSAAEAPTTFGELPCQAVDANMAFDRKLLVLLPNGLSIYDVAQFDNMQSPFVSRTSTPQLNASVAGFAHMETPFPPRTSTPHINMNVAELADTPTPFLSRTSTPHINFEEGESAPQFGLIVTQNLVSSA